MSIRTKLLLSYIAMIAVPVVLFGAVVMTAAGLYLRDMAPGSGHAAARQHRAALPFEAFRDLFGGRSELAGGLRFVAAHDPRLLDDPAFLADAEAELAKVDAGLLVLRGERTAYASPGLDADAITRQLQAGGSEAANAWPPRKPGGYGFDRIAYTAADGQSATLVIASDMEPVARFFRRFVPTVLLALVGALALTNGVLTYFVSRSIIRPLQALRTAAGHIREGELDRPVNLRRQDEIGQLGAAFEEMRVRLRDSIGDGLQLEQSRKELLASISHDLKTPITAIQGCVDCLQGGVADTEEKRRKYVAMIAGKAADMNRMIEELSLYSTLDVGRLPFRFERLELGEYVRRTVEELRLDPRLAGVRLELDVPRHDPASADPWPLCVQADREKLRRAILNVVENSLKHMEREPRILRFALERLAPGAPDEAVAIRIADNGTGIPEDALPHVFDRFFRAEPSRRTESGSSGLGLAIVKGIVEEHGGRVRAFSRPGEGTSIVIALPADRSSRITDSPGKQPT
ncbi:HAMP domain-containing histidine kinase [Paenibacillus sp. MWE-103]|uniref:histidine kinase n=1 Tax=Paenibacillus artemisiicola TaxID=1172618 RepID=A0ABS3WI35_9BACL|nr:HAMP domain-containing sensor histidine kinase [Paenibacillus artemisiicola]MBO7747984.1 HAMP domain-containing histidine kinase [Paenibacillus artemisiicola]